MLCFHGTNDPTQQFANLSLFVLKRSFIGSLIPFVSLEMQGLPCLSYTVRQKRESKSSQSDLTALGVTNNTSIWAAPWLYHQKNSLIKDTKRQYPLWRLGASGKFHHCALKCPGLISKAIRTVLPCQEKTRTCRGKRQLNHQSSAKSVI